MNDLSNIAHFSPELADSLTTPNGRNLQTHPTNAINQERKDETIDEQSSQSPHVSQNHRLENVRNSDAVDKICDGIVKIFSGLGRILGSLLRGVGKMLAAVLEGILDLIKNLVEKLREIINYTRSDVIPLANNTAQTIMEGARATGQITGAIHVAPIAAAAGGITPILSNLINIHPSQNT
ncbi:MAG: hypothetical protein LBR92_02860 [Puniceicoccales bacterium]|jgi:archaellum component FlaC|nr:hypothetical protein [Puniceicoccales bacterium]